MNGAFASFGLCLVGFIVLVIVIAAFNMIRVVPEYQRLVVFRLGRVLEKPFKRQMRAQRMIWVFWWDRWGRHERLCIKKEACILMGNCGLPEV